MTIDDLRQCIEHLAGDTLVLVLDTATSWLYDPVLNIEQVAQHGQHYDIVLSGTGNGDGNGAGQTQQALVIV